MTARSATETAGQLPAAAVPGLTDGPGACRPPLKIVVLDDDPTGSQTVHSCPLLLRWDRDTLLEGLRDPSPLLFLLANTRALDPDGARERVRGICQALGPALRQAWECGWIAGWQLVSRGDSTLRGHYPLEVEVLAAELGPFDATLLAPAFLEGGRTTCGAVHRLHGQPVHRTPFARDGLFGYRHSDLRAWVEEKSGGRIPATAVGHLSLQDLEGPAEVLTARLAALEGNVTVAVDAEQPVHLAALASAIRQLSRLPPQTSGSVPAPASRPATGNDQGPSRPSPGSAEPHDNASPATSARAEPARRFLIQSAAGLVGALADLPPQPLDAAGLAGLRRRGPAGPLPGLVVVGSHVPLADAQVECLLADRRCSGIEVSVPALQRVLDGPLPDRLLSSLEEAWGQQLRQALAGGRTPVLFSSRGEVTCARAVDRRALGLALASLMARLAAALAAELGYLISKGGITTHTLLSEGLGLGSVRLQGQLLPGLSLVLAGPARLPVLTFPGNLGEAGSLREAWRRMEDGGPAGVAPP
ncbi:MAG: four-carbon acid sugar kinase family protein [Cyanobium sp.]